MDGFYGTASEWTKWIGTIFCTTWYKLLAMNFLFTTLMCETKLYFDDGHKKPTRPMGQFASWENFQSFLYMPFLSITFRIKVFFHILRHCMIFKWLLYEFIFSITGVSMKKRRKKNSSKKFSVFYRWLFSRENTRLRWIPRRKQCSADTVQR